MSAIAVLLIASLSADLGSIRSSDPKKGEESWDGQIAFSASSATGNTENTVLGLAFDARRIHGRYTHDIQSGINYVESSKTNDDGDRVSERTQDRWFAQYRLEAQTADRTFVYGRVRYEEDQFSGFENRVFLGAGIGHNWIETDGMKWSVLAGPGYQYAELERSEDTEMTEADDPSGLAVYAGSVFNWDVRENVVFDHSLDATWTEDNTTAETVFGLKTKLTESISSRLNYRIKHETDPPENREATDTLLSASVVYGF